MHCDFDYLPYFDYEMWNDFVLVYLIASKPDAYAAAPPYVLPNKNSFVPWSFCLRLLCRP